MAESTGSIIVTSENDLSFFYKVLRTTIRPIRPNLVRPGKPLPPGSPKLDVPKLQCQTKEELTEGVYLYHFIPTLKPKEPVRHRLYYFAGGGFQMGPSKEHWKLCAELCKMLKDLYNVILVSYPLAPNNPAAKSLPILHKWLRSIMANASQNDLSVTLMGDSAGGNIALTLALWWARQALDEGLQSPLKNVVAISPAVDMRNENPEIFEADKHDPVLSVRCTTEVADKWTAGVSKADPDVSPLLADLEVLKRANLKVHGVVGTYDVLAPDAIKFRELLENHRIQGEWLQWEGQMHCFPLTFSYGMPEGKKGKNWIVDLLRRNV